MPSYEYQCMNCNMTLTIIRSISDKEHKPGCINCSITMTRIYQKPAIQFKGDGWAKNDK